MSIIGIPTVAPPNWKYRVSTKTFILQGGVNQVEISPQYFLRIVGKQTISVTDDTTGYTFSFMVSGGVGLLSGGYPNFYDQSANYNYVPGSFIGCSFLPSTTQNFIQIETPIGDSGGRFYTFFFSPYTGVQPQIQKSLVNPLVGNLTIAITEVVFLPS